MRAGTVSVLFTVLLPGLNTVPGTLKTNNPQQQKPTVSEINYSLNSLNGFNSRLYTTKDKIKEFVDKSIENIQFETQEEKNWESVIVPKRYVEL